MYKRIVIYITKDLRLMSYMSAHDLWLFNSTFVNNTFYLLTCTLQHS